MKFSNGCWIQKEGVAVFSPAEVYFTEEKAGYVKLVTPTHKVAHRGDTLGGANLTLEISSPAEGVIRVKTYHYKGALKDAPEFELNLDETSSAMKVENAEDTITVTSGGISLRIRKDWFSMEYIRDGKVISKSSGRDLAYVRTNWKGEAYVKSSDDDMYMRQQLTCGVGELFYGFGEKFTSFIRNGQTVEIWNEDGGTATDLGYKNIPFYVSNKGYGIFVNSPDKVSFEVCSEIVNKVGFTVPGEELDYFFIDGPEMTDVLRRYTDITGKPALPPAWTFGLWLSTSFTTNYDEATVMSFIDGMLERGIPLRVFHFDCFWMKDFHWTDFVWDERVFPDPKGLISRIHEKGLSVCVWINPYIAQESVLFDEGMEKGYFLKRPDGAVWQWDMWQPGMAIVDFSNPEAKAWFQDKLRELVDMGVDCFKTDFGERIPVDAVYASGKNPRKMHNYYTYQYNQAVFEVLEEKKGKDEAVLFARSATVGGQKFPVHWGGDCWSDYESMEQSLRGGLSLQMSGFGFWSHDIGGFENTSTPDVYKRWAAFGLLSSHSRLHGSTSYRVPWVYDDEAVDVVRFYTRLKARLMPYIWKTALDTHESGIPSMRSMVISYTKDKMCQYLDKQYMLGEDLLVAPIFNADSIAEFYLPKEKDHSGAARISDGSADEVWTDIISEEAYPAGGWVKKTVGYTEMPILARPNSIVCYGASDNGPEYDYAKDCTAKIYGLTGHAEAVVCSMEKKQSLKISAEKKDNVIEISIEGEAPAKVVLVNCKAASAEGANMAVEDGNTVLTSVGSKIVVTI